MTDTKPIARSFQRLVMGMREWKKTGEKKWHWFVRKESTILLHRVVKLWIQIRLRR